DGLLGLALDPDFSQNRWLYTFYTSPDGKEFRLSRFTLDNSGNLASASEKTLLRIPKEVLDGSHTGGGLTFNKKTGNLYITVGDNTSPRATPHWMSAPGERSLMLLDPPAIPMICEVR